MDSHHPGDVLADRYLLDALLSEVDGGRFWFAWDQVLARNVAIHVIPGDDPRAPRLLDAAGRAATVTDTRPLKILDAETLPDPGGDIVMVVNEWGHGTSLDHLITRTGPLPARHAAWVVAEVAAGIEAAHREGLAHGRLNPENVLIDALGSVRIIGLAVEAVLHSGSDQDPTTLPSEQETMADDVVDLAGMLHFALTGRWAGVSPSATPAVPEHHGRILRPRQVRAGVPRALDDLVDGAINPTEDGTPTQWTARAIASVLSQYVGDPTGISGEIVANTGVRVILPQVALSPFPERYLSEHEPPGAEPAGEPEVAPAGVVEEAEPDPEPAATTSRVDEPTEIGVPIFDEESDDVDWFSPRPTPPPPPPVLEEPPPKPLFAPDPPGGRPAPQPAPTVSKYAPVPLPDPTDSGYWPWATGTFGPVEYGDAEPDESGRNLFWVMIAVGLAILLAIGAWALFNLRDEENDVGVATTSPTSSATDTPSDLPEKIPNIAVDDFDPQDKSGEEFPELVRFAVDGRTDTSWKTSTYDEQLTPGGYKSGLGLVLDLGGEYSISEVRLRTVGSPTTASLYITDSAPTTVADLKPVRTLTVEKTGKAVFDPVVGSYLTVWLTKLPRVGDGFRGAISEVAVYGVFDRD